MRIIVHFRPLSFFFLKNWYGWRSGAVCSIYPKQAHLLDLGAVTIGWETDVINCKGQ